MYYFDCGTNKSLIIDNFIGNFRLSRRARPASLKIKFVDYRALSEDCGSSS